MGAAAGVRAPAGRFRGNICVYLPRFPENSGRFRPCWRPTSRVSGGGAALYAMQHLMYRLREDGETFTPAAAVKVARHRLCAAASADYWWIENHHEWLRDGGAKAHPTRTTTRAAWDQKWSGLQRRTPHKAAGHEAANSGAMSDGWLPPEERARHRDSIA